MALSKGRTLPSRPVGIAAIRGPRSRGIALVAVLWVVSLLAAIAASFAISSRIEVVTARNQIENAEARALADAGVHRAVLALASEERSATNGGQPAEWSFGGGTVTTEVRAESGKISLNSADVTLLAGLFTAARAADPSSLAAAVIDFRDADSDPLPRGAEDDDYRAAGLAQEAKDRPFERRDELLQVLGMTREIYEAVASAVTVYSRSRGIDPKTAPPTALAALQTLGVARLDSPGDSPYIVPSAVPIFTIRAEAKTEGGAVFVREAVVALTAGARKPFRVLTWEQGRR